MIARNSVECGYFEQPDGSSSLKWYIIYPHFSVLNSSLHISQHYPKIVLHTDNSLTYKQMHHTHFKLRPPRMQFNLLNLSTFSSTNSHPQVSSLHDAWTSADLEIVSIHMIKRKENRQIHTFSTHQYPIPSPFSTLPESTACFSDENCMADSAVFGPVYLFSGAVAAESC